MKAVVAVAIALLILLTLATPVFAGDALMGDALFAGIGTFFQSFATRSRVIQLCVVAMCLALVIIMKK